MSIGLRELLQLPERDRVDQQQDAEALRRMFLEGMAGLNSNLQVVKAQASDADFAPLETQRARLYEAFQKASSIIDQGATPQTEQSMQRLMAAVQVVEGKASRLVADASTWRDQWLHREAEFDDVMRRVGELEEAGHPKAVALRKLGDAIRTRANDRSYQSSVNSLEQLRPKLDQIYQQHQQGQQGQHDQQPAANGATPQAAPPPSPPGLAVDTPAHPAPQLAKEDRIGGVFPEIVWEQTQPEVQETDSMITELEEAQLPKATQFRKALDSIRRLADAQQPAKALDGYRRLRPMVDIEYARLYKSRTGGVQIPPAADGASSVQGAAPSPVAAAGTSRPSQPHDTPSDANGKARPGGFIGGSVGKGGRNDPADVEAVQEALNQRGGARLKVDGKYGPQTLKAIEAFQRQLGKFQPDGLIEPNRGTARALSGAAAIPPTPDPPKPIAPPELGKATLDKGGYVWHSTREILATNIEELKKGVRAFYGTEHRELLTQIDTNMVKLGTVLDKLDTRLADALDAAHRARTPDAQATELNGAQAIMRQYIQYMQTDPLITHMDKNPFGVRTSLQRIVTDALKHLAQLLPPPEKPAA
jgi:peptidoglycan hydrolase-like protein with peptidoglycan-binding domain